jgi:magnesium-transporting ATPase (P-type)
MKKNSTLSDNPYSQTSWYRLQFTNALELLKSSPLGLSDNEAAARLLTFGKNSLPTRKVSSLPSIIFRQVKSPLIYVLIAAGIASLLFQDFTDAFFIFIVVVINSVIGTIQEYKAEKSAEDLQKMIEPLASVKRNNEIVHIDASTVVPGDIIVLESGMRVCADARIIRAQNLSIDESILTGESTLVFKNTAPIQENDVETGDQINMAFGGTSVISGRAEAVVTTTGRDTQLGKITIAVTQTEAEELPLVKRMNQFVNKLTYIIVIIAIILSVITYLRGLPLLDVFLLSVALAVAAIPEGLPVALTVALTVGVNRMAKHKVIIRKLFAVEGLGSCTYIASDKTGTLTSNIQTVRKIVLFENNQAQTVHVTGDGYSGSGDVLFDSAEHYVQQKELLKTFIKQCDICNEGTLLRENGEWKRKGDPIDIALLALSYKAGIEPVILRNQVKITAEIPYESERKFAVAFYNDKDGKSKISVKGAAEKVLSFCKWTADGLNKLPVDTTFIKNSEIQLTNEGYRVIAVATGDLIITDQSNPSEKEIHDLTFLGFAGFIDPLRKEAKSAIEESKNAGIRVGMVTGDHPRTALAIARELGLAQHESELVTGKELAELKNGPAELLNNKIQSSTVFARTNPLQKVDIVSSLVAAGEFVAVTGDGVNDAPALRKAHLGIAMGSGNDVAKDTSSIIITDDNFASIVEGIRQGRIAYQNLRKVIYLLITAGLGEVLLFLLVVAAGLPIPLLAIQLLWLNLVTNGIQHIGIAFENGEPGVMDNPPRKPTEGIFNPLMIQETMLIGSTMGIVSFLFWWWEITNGVSVQEARNHLLLLMVLFLNYHAFNCRSETTSTFRLPLHTNKILVLGVFGALGIHYVSMHIPFMQKILDIQPVSFKEGIILLVIASSVLLTSELFKFALSKFGKSKK